MYIFKKHYMLCNKGSNMDSSKFAQIIKNILTNSIVDVKLSNMCLSQEQLNNLLEALKLNTSLQSIDLSKTSRLGVKEGIAIAELAMNKPNLKSINLGYCRKIGTEGAIAIAQTLEDNHTLTSINLDDNDIEEQGVKALAKMLKKNTNLISLSLWNNEGISGEGLEALACSLKENKTLQSIKLGFNQIGDNGAKALAEMLRENCTLKSLDLISCGIELEGIKALAESLKNNTTLTSINLTANVNISSEGALALAEALKNNNTLKSFRLTFNDNKDIGASALAQMLEKNTALSSVQIGLGRGYKGEEIIAKSLENNYIILEVKGIHDQAINQAIKDITDRNKEMLDTAFCKAYAFINAKDETNDKLSLEKILKSALTEFDIFTLKHHRAEVEKKLKEVQSNYSTHNNTPAITLEEFYHELEVAQDTFALTIGIFTLLGLPTDNVATSHLGNYKAKECNELYNFFTNRALNEESKSMLATFKEHYLAEQYNSLQMDVLWNKVVEYVGNELKWTEEDVTSLKGLEANIKTQDNTEQLKQIVLFHTLYPEYRSDIALTINEYIEEIKTGLIDSSELDPMCCDLVKQLAYAALPEDTRALVNDMLSELYELKPALFNNPFSSINTQNESLNYKFDIKTETQLSSGKEEVEEGAITSNENEAQLYMEQDMIATDISESLERSLSGENYNFKASNAGSE
ncbi:MAG: protein NLRC3-like [Rickettsiaceae bacterium]|nr:protein NLRC3-like [Rickettsiaceae bacterium]